MYGLGIQIWLFAEASQLKLWNVVEVCLIFSKQSFRQRPQDGVWLIGNEILMFAGASGGAAISAHEEMSPFEKSQRIQ